MKELVKIRNNKAVMTSREIAEVFGKEHRTVLRSIANIGCSEDFKLHNFVPISFKDSGNRTQTEYLVTRDGFMFLGMGFTGKRAAEFKELIIQDYNRVLSELENLKKPKLPKFLDRYILNSNKIPLGYFSVINVTFTTVYREMERVGYVLPDKGITGKDLMPDISIGRTFSDWLKKNGHNEVIKQVKFYKHEFVGRPSCEARMYPDSCYHLFTYFLKTVWIPQKASAYFKSKNPEALNYLPKLLK